MNELKGKYTTAKVFTDNIDQETISQIINLCNQDFTRESTIRIMPDCLTEDTEILTTDGFKLIKNLTLNDMVANYDKQDKKIFFDNPKNIIIRPLNDKEVIYKYYNNQHNFKFLVSENHRMAVENNMGQIAKNIYQIKMSEMIFNGFGLKNNIVNKYTDNEIKLICWIVGDGNIKVTHNENSDNYRIRFGFKKERKIERLLKILDEELINYNVSEDTKQITIMIDTNNSDKYIQLVGMDKLYPKDFIFLNKLQSKIFIDEIIYIDGDYEAYINKRGYRINSTEKENIDIISAIFAINYGYSKINFRQTESSFGTCNLYYINGMSYDTLQYTRSGVHNRKIKREIEKYNGNLVCVECTTSYFIARQNGLTFITGNCHAGKGCVIGFTADLGNKIIPNLIGVDIGCGMLTVELGKINPNLQQLDDVIHQYIPSGRKVHEGRILRFPKLQDLYCYRELKETKWIEKSIGTLGGGNHFIEVNQDDEDNIYLVIHSGSRNLGKQVADYYQNIAIELRSGRKEYYLEKDRIIKEYKEQGRRQEIQLALKKLETQYKTAQPDYPKELCFLEGIWREKYLHDMNICQEYALLNRETMTSIILDKWLGKNFHHYEYFQTIHNYINFKDNIIRKGSISAYEGEKVLIPINMRDGSLLCVGKGNSDWNYSAPHGAGRLMSRGKAKENISMEDYQKSMEGIFTTSVNLSTLDEAPMAYKPMEEIVNNIGDTVDILKVIKPIYNFKAGE